MKKAINFRSTLLAITAAATLGSGIAVKEAAAAGYNVGEPAVTAHFPNWDRLNIRKWPAAHSQKVAHIKVGKQVFVERCILKSGSDWCLISKGWKRGWVNGSYVRKYGHSFAQPHPNFAY